MSAGNFSAFAMAGQVVCDQMLALVQEKDHAAAEYLATAIAKGDAVLSVALTIHHGDASVELLLREDGRATPIATMPLRVIDRGRAN